MAAADNLFAEIRKEIDAIDTRLHDLLMERTALAVQIGQLKVGQRAKTALPDTRPTKPGAGSAYLRPAREAAILRRLIARHHGPLPAMTVIRIWRELMSALLRLQGPFAVAVHVPQGSAPHGGRGCLDLVSFHYGAGTATLARERPGQVLADIMDGSATIGVLPLPRADEDDPWWPLLLTHAQAAPRIIARLPFAASQPGAANAPEALVLGLSVPEATDDDRSYLILESDVPISRSALQAALGAAGLHCHGLQQVARRYLIECNGFIVKDDPRLGALADHFGTRAVLLAAGSYAVPILVHDVTQGEQS